MPPPYLQQLIDENWAEISAAVGKGLDDKDLKPKLKDLVSVVADNDDTPFKVHDLRRVRRNDQLPAGYARSMFFRYTMTWTSSEEMERTTRLTMTNVKRCDTSQLQDWARSARTDERDYVVWRLLATARRDSGADAKDLVRVARQVLCRPPLRVIVFNAERKKVVETAMNSCNEISEVVVAPTLMGRWEPAPWAVVIPIFEGPRFVRQSDLTLTWNVAGEQAELRLIGRYRLERFGWDYAVVL
jgi:hypothetical protein